MVCPPSLISTKGTITSLRPLSIFNAAPNQLPSPICLMYFHFWSLLSPCFSLNLAILCPNYCCSLVGDGHPAAISALPHYSKSHHLQSIIGHALSPLGQCLNSSEHQPCHWYLYPPPPQLCYCWVLDSLIFKSLVSIVCVTNTCAEQLHPVWLLVQPQCPSRERSLGCVWVWLNKDVSA